MALWRKVIYSGSNAVLNSVTASFQGNGSGITGIVSSSYALSASYAPSTPSVSASYAATASVGGGIYGSDGIAKSNVVVKVIDSMTLDMTGSGGFNIDDGFGNNIFRADASQVTLRGLDGGIERYKLDLFSGGPEATFTDSNATPYGLQYAGEYGSAVKTNLRSIPDVGTIKTYLTASYSISASYVSGAVINGGNNGAVVIGTNDSTALSFKTNNVIRQVLATGGALTHTDITATSSSVETNVIRIVNSSGTVVTGFGQRQLFQLESSTTDAQDASAIDTIWTTATHGSRQSAIIFSTVTNAAAVTELVRMDGRQMKVAGQYASTRHALTDSATIAVDWNNGNLQSVTLGGNRTFTFANPIDGGRYLLVLKQDATGSRTVTWPTVKWQGGLAPTLTTTANKVDLITIIYDGTDYYGVASSNF